jgi:type III secretory pathway component EscV
MTNQNKWLWIGAVVAAVVIALALGVPLGTLLIVAAVLLCPAVMYFGMRGMGERGAQKPSVTTQRSDQANSNVLPEEQERKALKTKP